MNIITTIQAALTALNNTADLFMLEKSRAENEELNNTTDTIIVYPDWRTTNQFTQSLELSKTRVYNIDFKTPDEWDNSDGSAPSAYESKTSADRIEDMEVLADSVISYISAHNDLFPEITQKLKWTSPRPILRANNGTMSGVTVQLTVVFSGVRICNYLPYTPEYQAVYDSWTTKPSDEVAAEQNTMVAGWVNSGVWAKKDVIYVFAAHTNDNDEALTNWKSPGTFDATLVNAPAFVALEGFTGDGVTQYIDTGFNLSSDSVNYQLNDASLGAYNRTEISSVNVILGASTALGDVVLYPKHTNGDAFYQMNNDSFIQTGAILSSLGHFIITRVASNSSFYYQNTNEIFNSAELSTALPDKILTFLASNNASDINRYYPGQIAAGFIGSGSTQQNVDDETDYLEAYMDSNGKGVIT